MSFSRFDAVVWATALLLTFMTGLVILLNPSVTTDNISLAPETAEGGSSLFSTDEPAILYLDDQEEGPHQIFLAHLDNPEQAQPLTLSPTNILDFAVSPDGEHIAYSTLTDNQGVSAELGTWATGLTEIWIIAADGTNPRMVLSCAGSPDVTIPEASCLEPVWLPDSRRLIYERRSLSPDGLPGNPRLWWLDIETGETIPVFSDSQILGLLATVSPDGRWLSFVSPAEQAIRIFNLETGADTIIPNQMGAPASWHPDSQLLAFADIVTARSYWSMELMTLSLSTNETRMLTDVLETENNNPVWSPDGDWLAFGRKKANAAMGRQIWLINADGSEERQLTDNDDLHHAQFSWSPDGRYLVYQQYNLQELYAQPSIWIIDHQTGETTAIATSAMQPAWLP